MYKLALKCAIVTLVFLGISIVFSGAKALAYSNCPSGTMGEGNWGATTGGHSNAMAGLIVYAHVGSYTNGTSPPGMGNPISGTWYDLHSDLPGLSTVTDGQGKTYPADQRIFAYPPGSGGRWNEKQFQTGETLHAGGGSNWAYSCPGWSVLGPGNDTNQQGNGYVLDCGEEVNGRTYTTQYWISSASNPSGQSGRWELQVNGSTVTNDLNNDPNPRLHSFTETNGGNVRIDLIWHQKAPQPPTPVQDCNSATIYDDGGHNGNHTYVNVTITGTNNDQNNYHIGYQEHHTFGYEAISPVITIERNRFENTGTSSSPNWVSYSDTIQRITCYHATCYPGHIIDGLGPHGEVYAGQQFTIAVPFWNDGPQTIPAGAGGYRFSLTEPPENGHGFVENDVGHDVDPGTAPSDVVYVNITQTAPATAQNVNYNFYPDMYGHGAIGNGPSGAPYCTTTVPIYQHFALEPHATLDKTGTQENPGTITYSTYVQNNTNVAISAPSTSSFTSTPYGGGFRCNSVGPVNTNGPYNPGGPNYTISPGNCKPASFNAGDQFCSYISLTYNQGYVGPSGNVIDTSADSQATSGPNCVTVVNKPYFKAYGGGITAGGNFSDTGQCTGGGLLAGWNDNKSVSGQSRGSGSQLSALAMLKITGVASAQSGAVSTSPQGTGLTFANKNNSLSNTAEYESPILGGNFDTTSGSHCLPDVSPPKTSGTDTTSYSSSTTIGGRTVSGDQSIFVNGDAYISGNITYSNGWSVKNKPSFVLHATGNIYIDPSVTELDGIYIGKHKIYTCGVNNGNNNFAPMSASNLYDKCKNQLIVYGNFVAQRVNLMRTYGSLRNATNGEQPASGSLSCSYSGGPGNKSSCAGEILILSPANYMSTPAINLPSNGAVQYDAITSLPPVL